MDSQPIRDHRIIEALEACRPGSADLSDPALAHLAAEIAADPRLEKLYERLQQVDARLAAAFHDVPVPAGLAERLLATLAADRAVRAALPQGDAAAASPATPPQRAAAVGVAVGGRRPRWSRRWLLAAVVPASACVAAGLVLAVWLLVPDSKSYTASMVLEEALALFQAEMDDPVSSVPGRLDAPPKDYPFSRDIVPSAAVRWRPVKLLGRYAVAYDLPAPGGSRATLYVVRCTVDELPFQPPPQPRPEFSTGNSATSAWQDGQLLYVLVVTGGEGVYRGFIEPPRGPIA